MGVGSTYNRRTFQLLRLCSRPGLYLLPPHSGPVSPALGRYPGARHQKRHQILIHWPPDLGAGGRCPECLAFGLPSRPGFLCATAWLPL